MEFISRTPSGSCMFLSKKANDTLIKCFKSVLRPEQAEGEPTLAEVQELGMA